MNPSINFLKTICIRCAVVMLLLFVPAHATTYLSYSLDAILQKADIIVFAEVSDVKTIAINGKPWTEVGLESESLRVLKGDEEKAAQAINFYGGVTESGTVIIVDGMPQFRKGMNVLLMRYDAQYASPLVGFSQGLWEVQARGLMDKQGRILAVNAAGELGFLQDFQEAAAPTEAPTGDATAVAGEVKPDDVQSGETKPDDVKPDETKPDETKPDEQKPDDAKPDAERLDEVKPDASFGASTTEEQPFTTTAENATPENSMQEDAVETTLGATSPEPNPLTGAVNPDAITATTTITGATEATEAVPNTANSSDQATSADIDALGIVIDTDAVLAAIEKRLTELTEESGQ